MLALVGILYGSVSSSAVKIAGIDEYLTHFQLKEKKEKIQG